MEFWTIIGYLAALCGATSLIPEVVKAYKSHHLQDVSWGMLYLFLSSSILWGSYGIHIQDLPLVASAVINFSMESALIVMKKHYSMTGKPLREHFAKNKLAAETEPVRQE